MSRSKTITALAVLAVLAIIATIGVVATIGGTGTPDISDVTCDPAGWEGEQVTLEGVVGMATDYLFVLWDETYCSKITVKWDEEPPAGGAAGVVVTGTVEYEKLFGEYRLSLVAGDWRYAD